MKTFKLLLFRRFKIISFLTVSMMFSIFILTLRIKLTHSFFLIFLIWNLFLAIIPFTITFWLRSKNHIKKIHMLAWFIVWLLFLPNAPYIVTDLIHLKLSSNHLIWLDTMIIVSFACSGLALFYISIIDMLKLASPYYKKQHLKFLVSTLFLLTAFGIYLGRFLRYNSWDLLQNPLSIAYDIVLILSNPKEHTSAWIFTLTFALLLNGLFILLKRSLKVML